MWDQAPGNVFIAADEWIHDLARTDGNRDVGHGDGHPDPADLLGPDGRETIIVQLRCRMAKDLYRSIGSIHPKPSLPEDLVRALHGILGKVGQEEAFGLVAAAASKPYHGPFDSCSGFLPEDAAGAAFGTGQVGHFLMADVCIRMVFIGNIDLYRAGAAAPGGPDGAVWDGSGADDKPAFPVVPQVGGISR